MMDTESEILDSTRRCLFPADGDRRFESQRDSAPMIDAMNPKNLDTEALPYSLHSPTTVLGYFPSSSSEKNPSKSLHSTIVMCEDGAEVTLNVATLPLLGTPAKLSNASSRSNHSMNHRDLVRGRVGNISLMDVEWTPTPPPSRTKPAERDHGCAHHWCGNPSANCVFDDTYEVSFSPALEEDTSLFQGGDDSYPMPFDEMSDWDLWQQCSVMPNDTHVGAAGDDDAMETFRLKLRDRDLNPKNRRTRIHQLRRDLSPFTESPERRSSQLPRTQSFSVSEHQSAIVRQSAELQHGKSSFSNVLKLCTLTENTVFESPMPKRYQCSDERGDTCYDSDPEDFARHRSPMRSPTNKENQHFYPSSPRIGMKDIYNACDHSVIQEFLNRTFTLVYHPCVANEGDANEGVFEPSRPIGVDVWLERGQRLSALISPKLMWRPKSRYQKKAKCLMFSTEARRSLELLDIKRILKVSGVDRRMHPFAKSNRCLLVQNIYGEEICFEAKSTEERDLVVFSLKLVIARFGAMVIASNHEIFDEFFISEHCVPGNPPQVLDMLNDESD